MADNVPITAGTGTNIASDDIGAVQYQRIKLIHGADGVNAGDVSTANPLPIFDPDATATGTITVTDAVVAAPAGAGAFVTGASTAGSLVFMACPGGDGAWNVQITALTSGTLYFEGSLDSTTGTDGQWINVNGRRTGVVNTELAGNLTANGMWRGNTSGLKYFRVRSVGALTGTPAVVIRISAGVGAIFLNASIPAGANVIGKAGIDQTTPGTTNLVALAANQSVNKAQINGVTPLMGNGVTGTGAQRVTIASDNTAFAVNATLQTGAAVIGALSANQSANVAQINGVTTLMGNGITGTGSQRVTVASDNTPFPVKIDQTTPGTTNLVALAANQSVNKAQINGVAPLMGNGVTGTGSQRVTLASDNSALPAAGQGAIAAAAPAGATMPALKAATANPTNATAGNLVAPMGDKAGRAVITPVQVRELTVVGTLSVAATAETTLIAAGGAGVFNDIIGIIITTAGAAAQTITIKDGTAGTTRAVFNYPNAALAPGAPFQAMFPVPLPQSAANANWTVTQSVATACNYTFLYAKNL